MANADHLKIIREQGVVAWNKRRDSESFFFRPDLNGADLRDADLQAANFHNVDLRGADLSGANLREADFENANLCEANLRGATLTKAILTRADLSRAVLCQAVLIGATLWKATLAGADLSGPDLLQGADLSNAQLSHADLREAHLHGAILQEADLFEATLSGADLSAVDFGRARLVRTDLSEANLSGAGLNEADLHGADLHGADLAGASLHQAFLLGANLRGATLHGANLRFANLVQVDFTDADLTGCHVYGTSAWGLTLSQDTKQQNLIITDYREFEITLDNIEVAQFVYLLLHNAKIRGVIDTITTKVVLILGRFTDERRVVLDALRDELRRRDYLPILFDFDKPTSRTTDETITLLARMARFVIADISDAKSVLQELRAIVPELPSVAVQPIIITPQEEPGMFDFYYKGRDDPRYPSILPVHRYDTPVQLLADLSDRVIGPAEAKVAELRATTVAPPLSRKTTP